MPIGDDPATSSINLVHDRRTFNVQSDWLYSTVHADNQQINCRRFPGSQLVLSHDSSIASRPRFITAAACI